MPLYFTIPIKNGDLEIEITDDGALVLLNYDIEPDMIAAEFGDDPSIELQILYRWQEEPINSLISFYRSSPKVLPHTIINIGEMWLFLTMDTLQDAGCLKDENYRNIINESVIKRKRLWTRFDSSNVSKAAVKVIKMHKPDHHLTYMGSPSKVFDKSISNLFNDLLNEKEYLIRALAWCHRIKIEDRMEFFDKLLKETIAIIQEDS